MLGLAPRRVDLSARTLTVARAIQRANGELQISTYRLAMDLYGHALPEPDKGDGGGMDRALRQLA